MTCAQPELTSRLKKSKAEMAAMVLQVMAALQAVNSASSTAAKKHPIVAIPPLHPGERFDKKNFSVSSCDLVSTHASFTRDTFTRDSFTRDSLLNPGLCETMSDIGVDEEEALLREGATTFMVRNIPMSCTQEMLVEEWPVDGSYDLLYLPRSSGGKANLGYAFINLASSEEARAFYARWHKRRLPLLDTEKHLLISRAEVQGFHANVEQLKKKRAGKMRSRQCKPIIVKDGRVVSLDDV